MGRASRNKARRAAVEPVDWRVMLGRSGDLRRDSREFERLGVDAARAEGVSWDEIAAALGGYVNGETIRRRYGRERR